MAAIFDLWLTPTTHSIQTSPIVFLDLENVGIAVEISLLSCIQAEIYVIICFSYLLPVYGRHFDFRLDYSHQLYIIEVLLGRPTVWWKPHEKIPTRSEDNRGGASEAPSCALKLLIDVDQ